MMTSNGSLFSRSRLLARKLGTGVWKRWRWMVGFIGVGLIIASLALVFCATIPAGFYFTTGLIALAAATMPWHLVEEIRAGSYAVKLYREMRVAVEETNASADRVMEVERTFMAIVSEMVAERGDNPNFGRPGEVPLFAIYGKLREAAARTVDLRLQENLERLHRYLAIQLITALLGDERQRPHPDWLKGLRAGSPLPTEDDLRHWAVEAGVDITEHSDLLGAYGRFVADGVSPPEELVVRLEGLRRKHRAG